MCGCFVGWSDPDWFQSEQLLNTSCDFLDQHFKAARGGRGDDFLVDTVAPDGSGRDVAWLPVTSECGDEDGTRSEAGAELLLEDLIEFSGDEDPNHIAADSESDFQGTATPWGESLQAGELTGELFGICADNAEFFGVAKLLSAAFFREPGFAGSECFRDGGEIMSPWNLSDDLVPAPGEGAGE